MERKEIDKFLLQFVEKKLTMNKKNISKSVTTREYIEDNIVKRCFSGYLHSPKKIIHYGSALDGTNRGNIGDYDSLVVFHCKGWEYRNYYKGVGNLESNEFLDACSINLENGRRTLDLKLFFNKFVKVFRDNLPSNYQPVVRDTPAVTLTFRKGRSDELRLDYTPALILVDPQTDREIYMIPSGEGWIRVNALDEKEHIRELQSLTKAVSTHRNNNFKNLIRLLKEFGQRFNVPTFPLKYLAILWAMNADWSDSISTNIQNFLKTFIEDFLHQNIRDPSTGANLSERFTSISLKRLNFLYDCLHDGSLLQYIFV